MSSNGIDDDYTKICEWWGVEPQQLRDDDKVRVIGISLGVGSVFNDDRRAEQTWMNSPHLLLDNWSPLECLEVGMIADVEGVVDNLRGLK